jgi:aromatic ring-opening dioxygenase catalytic subunit (LigB family)
METPAWETALSQLPKTDRIPAFFFAHGCKNLNNFIIQLISIEAPILIYPENRTTGFPQELFYHGGPRGPLAQFLRFFGPFLLKTYKPKALVVFSAHWEAENTIEGFTLMHVLFMLTNGNSDG